MDEEEILNWRLILTPAGLAWSGRARYAAAMYFHQRDRMSDEVLEIYRICSRLDDEDPLEALRAYHLGEAWIAAVEARRQHIG